ncbi:MAG: alanyl-tRNA editing protein [Caldilinea sp. CFX5]|nr:alanyl-tRNA editing protein [Caldilinea sp. CFX5]
MTTRLYYTNAYQTEFTANVTTLTTVNGQLAVILDQSCFYPTSGGQPNDTGILGGKAVLDVMVDEQGEVLHLLAEPLAPEQAWEPITGQLDWPRRYDHMQQHSGQHLLSQLFYQHFGFETVAVHFGAVESTLDLATPEVTPAQVEALEQAAMQLVYAALPIKAYFVSDQDLPTIPLRRAPKVTGTIRIVEIDGFDYSACGGTHCRTTAEIGPIKLTKTERRRGQVRITFLCGQRAWRDYQVKHGLITTAANLFSNEITQVPALVERNLGQIKELQQTIDGLQEELLRAEALQLLSAASFVNGYRLLSQHFADRAVNLVKRLALQVQQQPRALCLFSVQQGEKATLIFARSADLDLHVGNLLRDILREVGGKGGGREDFAQGGGITIEESRRLLPLSATMVEQLTSADAAKAAIDA